MNINVRSQREKELLQEFSEFLVEYLEDTRAWEIFKKYSYDFQQYELEFVKKAFQELDIYSRGDVDGIYLDSEYLTGVCDYCGKIWVGIEGVDYLSIEEYESYLQEEELGYHIECSADLDKCVK